MIDLVSSRFSRYLRRMTDPLSWDDLRLFLAIVRAGTLTSAAKTGRLSQPTLGRRLQQIEARAGQPLLQRSSGRFVPTEAGRTAVATAIRMEHEANALDRQLHASGQAISGLLRLSSSEWFARHILTPRLVSFQTRYPDVVLELIAETKLLDLDRRDADMVFRFRRFEETGVLQRHFAQVAYGAFATAEVSRRLADADADSVALIAMDTALADLADVDWIRERLPGSRIGFRSNSRDIQAQACAAGSGVAVLPLVVGTAYGLEIVDLGEPPPSRDVWLGYHADLRNHPATRALIAHVTPDPGFTHCLQGLQSQLGEK